MANCVGTTVSSNLETDVEQQAKLEKILNKYSFMMEDVYIRNEIGSFHVCGHDWLTIVDEQGDSCYDDRTEDFCEDVRKILKDNQKFVIVSVGNEKLRYASGTQITITPEKVEWINIGV